MDARLSLAFTAAIGAFLVWLALWGSGGSEVQAGGRSAIEQMLNRTLTENDPAQCTEDMTPAFVEQSFAARDGKTSIERCLEENTDDSDAAAHSVTIKSVTVTGSTARAVAVAHGGNMDGSQVTVDLVAEGGRWKVNHLTDLQIDRPNVDRMYLRRMQAAGATPSESRCVVRALDRQVSDEDLERAALSPTNRVSAEGIGLGCLGRPTLVHLFERNVAAEVRSRGVPSPVADCIASRFTDGMGLAELRGVVKADHLSQGQGQRVRAIAEECAIAYRSGSLPQSGSV